jgi:hypothetical protein
MSSELLDLFPLLFLLAFIGLPIWMAFSERLRPRTGEVAAAARAALSLPTDDAPAPLGGPEVPWAEVMAALMERGVYCGERLVGTLEGCLIEVTGEGRGATITAGSLPAGVALRPQRFDGVVGRALSGGEIEVGDPEFDRAVLVRGPERVMLAALDARTRARVAQGLGERLEVGDGQARRRLYHADITRLSREAPALALLAAAFRQAAADPVPGLARNLREDPLPAVRRRNLEVLLRLRQGDAGITDDLRAALEDPAPEVAAAAALALGELPRLRQLVRDPALPEELRQRVRAALGEAPQLAGAFSLAAGGAGGLSLTSEAGEGALSEAAGDGPDGGPRGGPDGGPHGGPDSGEGNALADSARADAGRPQQRKARGAPAGKTPPPRSGHSGRERARQKSLERQRLARARSGKKRG